MKTIILAGGKGTRLKPYTISIPKPLVPIGDLPILEIVIRQFKKHGFTDIILSVNHMSELIRSYFGNGKKFGVEIEYSLEEKPLGTAGPLALIKNISKQFMVMNGDLLTDLDFSELVEYHRKDSQIATVVSYKKEVPIELGILEINKNNFVNKYIEKPKLKYHISTGIYVFDKKVLSYISKNEYMDLPDLITILIKKGEKVKAYNFKGLWFDIGSPSEYEEAIKSFEKNRKLFL